MRTFPGGGGTPLFGLYGDVPLDRVWFFGLAVLNRVCNLTCLCPKQVKACPKQGMVLQAERLQPRLRGVSFFSWLATRGLREVERACDRPADKRRASFPELHNINWKPTVNRTLQCHQSTSD